MWRVESLTSGRKASLDEFPEWEGGVFILATSAAPLLIEAIEKAPGLELRRITGWTDELVTLYEDTTK